MARRLRPRLVGLAAAVPLALALASTRSAGAVSRQRVDEAVEEVFSRPAFEDSLEASGSTVGALVSRALGTIAEWFQTIMGYLDGLRHAAPVLFWFVVVALCLVLVALLAHIGWTLSLAFRQAPSIRAGVDDDGEEQRVRHFRELREDARRAACEGRLRDATHYLLLSLLALLEERQALRVAIGWTNREILGRIRVQEDVAGSLSEFSDSVERVWYGGEELGAGEFEALDRVLDELAPRLVAGASPGASPGGAS